VARIRETFTEPQCNRVRTIRLHRAVLALFAVLAVQSPTAQTVAEVESNPASGQVLTYCHPQRLGQVVAEIRWLIKSSPVAAVAARQMLRENKLGATTYENGFKEERAVYFKPFVSGRAQPLPRTAATPKLVGLDRLTLLDTSTSQIAPRRALLMPRPADAVGDDVTFVVANLQPGMRYFWSFDVPGQGPQLATVLAPACPVDEAGKERRR
jgi:hypothetical protein